MIYTSTAHRIDREALNAYDAMLVAEREAISTEQDWHDGVSLFSFHDGSQLRAYLGRLYADTCGINDRPRRDGTPGTPFHETRDRT